LHLSVLLLLHHWHSFCTLQRVAVQKIPTAFAIPACYSKTSASHDCRILDLHLGRMITNFIHLSIVFPTENLPSPLV